MQYLKKSKVIQKKLVVNKISTFKKKIGSDLHLRQCGLTHVPLILALDQVVGPGAIHSTSWILVFLL